jgi:2'-5' RNA ligase
MLPLCHTSGYNSVMNYPIVYDIVLLPSKPVNDLSIQISQRLRPEGTEFTLEDGVLFPHLSLYMANFAPEQMQQLKAALADIAARTPALPLTATHYGHNLEQGMFEIFYQKTPGITRLQEDVLATCNPLRTGLRHKDPVGRVLVDYFSASTGEVHENIQRFGYDEIGNFFKPHITFTRFKQRDHKTDLRVLPAPSELTDTFAVLGLFEMGENGTCTRQIAVYDLAG